MNITKSARTIRCFQCNRTGHLQSHSRMNLDKISTANLSKMSRANLNKRPRALICNRYGGFGHIERICHRVAVLVAEPEAVNVSSIYKANNELEISRAENEQLRVSCGAAAEKRRVCSEEFVKYAAGRTKKDITKEISCVERERVCDRNDSVQNWQ